MAPEYTLSESADRRHTPVTTPVRLWCERLEDRHAPALFTVGTPIAPGITASNNNGCVAVGDLNKDGRPDIVMSNYGPAADSGAGNFVTVMYGVAGGGFGSPQTVPAGGTNISFVDLADINGDGWLDVVATAANKQGVGAMAVFRNDGLGNLAIGPGSPFGTGGNNPSGVRLADMTGDGVLDAVICNFGKVVGENVEGMRVTVLPGNAGGDGKGNFTFGSPLTLTAGPEFVPTAVAVADFDGDGLVDVAAVSPGVPPDFGQPYPNGNVYVFRNQGGGSFAAALTYDTKGVFPVNVQAADVNKDGKADLVVANAGDPESATEFAGNSVGVITNTSIPGSLSFNGSGALGLTVNTYGTFAVAVADLNLDSNPDIAAINYGSQTLGGTPSFVAVYKGNGLPGNSLAFNPDTPTATYNTFLGLPGGQYLGVGDFNGDTAPDVVAVGATGMITVLSNTTVPPKVETVTVNAGTADLTQRSRVTRIAVRFDSTVTISAGAFTLKRVGTYEGEPGDNATVTPAFTTVISGGKTTATLTFSGANTLGGSLNDGVWELTVDRTKVRTTTGSIYMGANYTSPTTGTGRIFRLFGDIDGNGQVNGQDAGIFDRAFGLISTDPLFVAAFDWNGDNQINGQDAGIFDRNFGRTM